MAIIQALCYAYIYDISSYNCSKMALKWLKHGQPDNVWAIWAPFSSQGHLKYSTSHDCDMLGVIIYRRSLGPGACILGRDKLLHPRVYYGMYLLMHALDPCFWLQSVEVRCQPIALSHFGIYAFHMFLLICTNNISYVIDLFNHHVRGIKIY